MEKNNWLKKASGLIVILIIAIILINIIPKRTKNSQTTNSNENSVYEKVISSSTIRACYIVTPPSLIKDPNTGKLSGASFDILEQATKNLGLKLSWDYEVGWGEAIEALNTGKCDILGSAIWGNSNRGKTSEFIEPIYYSAINAYVRANDNRFDNNLSLANNEKIKLAVADGSTTYLISGRQFPKAQTIKLAESSDSGTLMMNVVDGKADMTFAEASQIKLYEKNNPGKSKAVLGVKPVAVYEDVMLVKKGEFKLKTTMDGAIKELLFGGFIDKTLDKYEESGTNVFYRVATPYMMSQ